MNPWGWSQYHAHINSTFRNPLYTSTSTRIASVANAHCLVALVSPSFRLVSFFWWHFPGCHRDCFPSVISWTSVLAKTICLISFWIALRPYDIVKNFQGPCFFRQDRYLMRSFNKTGVYKFSYMIYWKYSCLSVHDNGWIIIELTINLYTYLY